MKNILRSGDTIILSSRKGELGEIVFDSTKKTLVVYDGVLAGGFSLASEQFVADMVDQVTGGLSQQQIQTLIDSSLAPYALTSSVNVQLDSINDNIAGLASTVFVQDEIAAAISDKLTTAQLQTELSGYATDADLTTAVNGLATTSYVDTAISTATTGLITSAQLTTAVQDLASESFVQSEIAAITSIDTAERLVTADGWVIETDAVTHAVLFKYNNAEMMRLSTSGMLTVPTATVEVLTLLSGISETLNNLGSVTSSAITIDADDGSSQRFDINTVTLSVTADIANGRSVTIRITNPLDATVTWTNVNWVDSITPGLSTTLVNFVHLWAIESTVYGVKIGEF